MKVLTYEHIIEITRHADKSGIKRLFVYAKPVRINAGPSAKAFLLMGFFDESFDVIPFDRYGETLSNDKNLIGYILRIGQTKTYIITNPEYADPREFGGGVTTDEVRRILQGHDKFKRWLNGYIDHRVKYMTQGHTPEISLVVNGVGRVYLDIVYEVVMKKGYVLVDGRITDDQGYPTLRAIIHTRPDMLGAK